MELSKQLLGLLLSCFSLQLFAQTIQRNEKSLIGTWIETTDSLQEIKMISPTHVFFIVQNLKADTFAYAGAGTYRTKGNQYTENLQYANFEINNTGYNYTYKVEGDKFYQKGVFTFADGTQVPINHTFTRVKSNQTYTGSHVGTWNQLSSSFTMADGTRGSHTKATHIRFQIITPTHWMRISEIDNKFENAFGGTYTLEGNKFNAIIDYTSIPSFKSSTVVITQHIEGNKMYWSGIAKDSNGKQIGQFEDVFERASAQPKKSDSASM